MRIPANPLRPAHVERDATRVRSRRHDKVILQLPLVAVVNQVNVGIDCLVLHLRVGQNMAAPLRRIIADEVVARARQLIQARNLGRRIGIAELHPQHATGHALSRRFVSARTFPMNGFREGHGFSRATSGRQRCGLQPLR